MRSAGYGWYGNRVALNWLQGYSGKECFSKRRIPSLIVQEQLLRLNGNVQSCQYHWCLLPNSAGEIQRIAATAPWDGHSMRGKLRIHLGSL
ncbi:hypothetical protein SKAU_G00351700 [Synaphobranchus kaupii]|uniref:Uncharacterized protein n=1 Tax=Synaphobranchus kaupii TaxID=118154 RepID=A0A9Q1EKM4_SYNKA|nr:hypothetical protein SKAU_G00351700 [Synaphobranchus kaupii]